MKSRFVLDEGVIICAATGKNERDVDDSSSIDLIRRILKNCHSLVWSTFLWGKWAAQFNTVRQRGQAQNPEVIRLLTAILTNSEKQIQDEDPPALAGEEALPNDEVDRHVVRLAVHNQAVLTTVDNPLIVRLHEYGFPQKSGLVAVRPEAALPYAGPQ